MTMHPNEIWTWLTKVLLEATTDKESAVASGVSDIHLLVGVRPLARRGGVIAPIDTADWELTQEHMDALLAKVLRADQRLTLRERRSCDATLLLKDTASKESADSTAFRIHCYYQRDSPAIAIRRSPAVPVGGFSFDDLGIPAGVEELLLRQREGLVLVTGPTGAGKSTTLAAMVDFINRKRSCRILTVEDPIEFYHTNAMGYVVQQEVGRDVLDFNQAAISTLREDLDVVMIGEMRDLTTVRQVVHLAGTGHLVLATFHANGAAHAAQQIIGMFPAEEQFQCQVTLARVLCAVIAQELVPTRVGGHIVVTELLQFRGIYADLIANGADPDKLRSQMFIDEEKVDLSSFRSRSKEMPKTADQVKQADKLSRKTMPPDGHTRLLDLSRLCLAEIIAPETALEHAGPYKHDMMRHLQKLGYTVTSARITSPPRLADLETQLEKRVAELHLELTQRKRQEQELNQTLEQMKKKTEDLQGKLCLVDAIRERRSFRFCRNLFHWPC